MDDNAVRNAGGICGALPLARRQLSFALSGAGAWMSISLEIIGDISEIETIAVGISIREIARLRRSYGPGRWRKMKGKATIRLPDGIICKLNCIGMRPMVLGERI